MSKMRISLMLLVLACSLNTWARVFDFNKEIVASYLSINGGNSQLGNSAFSGVGASDVQFDQTSDLNYGAEIGAIINLKYLNFRVGVGFLRPKSLVEARATDSTGTLLYKLNSDITAVMPLAGLEFFLEEKKRSRVSLALTGGLASVDMQNNYSFTSEGLAAYSLSADYREQGQGSAYMGSIAIIYETLMTDTVTANFELGYRELIVESLVHKIDANTILGSVTAGDQVKNTDGSNRALNLSSYYIGVSFRFYIGIL